MSHAWLVDENPETRFQAGAGQTYRMVRALLRNPLAVVGLVIILGLLIVAAFAPVLAPYSPIESNLGARLLAPSADHWMGTDELGRDILSRIIHGAHITLMIVLLVAVISAPVG
ncbi:MAG: hypothetical protein R3311_21970, partial [Oceanisphaera sp.]|nr:hypothetical protein [Oceanisphaera sp.]